MKRTPLARGKPLKRGKPLARGGRLSARSKRRETEAAERAVTRELVFARDGYRCQMRATLAAHAQPLDSAGACFGPLTPHHIRKAGQGGEHSLANLLSLCAFHNDWCEDHPAKAHALGLVRRAGE